MNNELENGNEFKGIHLDIKNSRRSDKNEDSKRVTKDVEKLFSDSAKCIEERFQSVNDKKFKNFKVFCPKQWPLDNQTALSSYGREEIDFLVSMYRDCLKKKGFQLDKVVSEWSSLLIKLLVEHGIIKLEVCNSQTFWPQVLRDTEKVNEYGNVLALPVVKIMLVIPVSSAEAARGFSWMGRVKSDLRSRFKTSVMKDLMTIHMCGDSVETFDPKPSVLSWWKSGKKKSCLESKYGPQACKQRKTVTLDISDSQSESDLSSSDSELQ